MDGRVNMDKTNAFDREEANENYGFTFKNLNE